MIRIGRFPFRTLLGTRPGLGTQPRYEAPGDLRVEYVKRKWLTSGEWGCLLDNGPKLAVGKPNSSQKNKNKKNKTLHRLSVCPRCKILSLICISVEADIGRWTLVLAFVDTYLSFAFSRLICRLEDTPTVVFWLQYTTW